MSLEVWERLKAARYPLETGLLLALCFVLPLYEAPKNVFWIAYVAVWMVNRARAREFGGPWDLWDSLIAVWIASGFVVAAFAGLEGTQWRGAADLLRYGSVLWLVKRAGYDRRQIRAVLGTLVASAVVGLAIGHADLLRGRAKFGTLELHSVGHVNHTAIYLAIMLTYGADLFLLWPGLVLACLGLLPGLALFNGPLTVFGIGFSLHWMLFLLLLGVAGFQALLMGILARVIYDPERHEAHLWQRHFRFNRVTLTCAALFALGITATSGLIWEYVESGFRLPPELGVNSYRAVAGIALCLLASLYFTFSLVFNAVYELTAPPQQP